MSVVTTIKPWGKEELLEHNKNYAFKRLLLNSGERTSLQYHNKKTETIYVVSGRLEVRVYAAGELGTVVLDPGEHLTILVGVLHQMRAGSEDVVYLEASTPELNDVVRVEDSYGRT